MRRFLSAIGDPNADDFGGLLNLIPVAVALAPIVWVL